MASDLRPALVGSVLLHVLVIGAGLIVFPQSARQMRATAVPVTIVSRAPIPDLRPAIEAPETQTASTPEPTPAPEPEAAPPPPPPPAPAPPSPAPPRPPTLDLNALASKMAPPKAQPRPAPLDLNALASRLPRRDAPRGEDRAETSPDPRPALGAAQGLTADEASLLASKLNRLWRPNCGVEGAANVQVRVNIQLLPNGMLAAARIVGAQSSNPVWAAAAQRALSAVRQGEPYSELPRNRYAQWKDINFNFNARAACQGL